MLFWGLTTRYKLFLLLTALTCLAPSVVLATTYTVSKTADTNDGTCDADCSFREAITAANGASSNTINFSIPGGTDGGCTGVNGVCTISLLSTLPNITGAGLTIDGYTQGGASVNTNAFPGAFNGTLRIVLNGTSAGAGADGLTVNNVGSVLIKGLVINRFPDRGVVLTGASATGIKIQGCIIGLDDTGEIDQGNTHRGIEVITNANNNIIGTDGDGSSDNAERNLISGNDHNGIYLDSTGNTVMGNFIGTDKDGNTDLGNANVGVYLNKGSNTLGTNGNGTSDAIEGNVISGNDMGGIGSNTANSNIVAGNYIGLAASGTAAVPNTGHGLVFISAFNRIGTNGDLTSDALERNYIGSNTINGILLTGATSTANTVAGNFLGVGSDGSDKGNGQHGMACILGATNNVIGHASNSAFGNTIAYNGDAASEYGVQIFTSTSDGNQILHNSIYQNQSAGIFLDTGANNNKAVPVISSQVANGASIDITGTATTNDTVELFDASSDNSGQTFLGMATATGGNWTITISGVYTATGNTLVATATDVTNGTSIFTSAYTINNLAPVSPSALGPASAVDGSNGTDTTPDLTFTVTSDPNNSDTSQYQIQVDDTADFSSPVVDYVSALGVSGAQSFTVGQVAGTGTYTTGYQFQTLPYGSYYWRVRAIDNASNASSYASANAGAVAFVVKVYTVNKTADTLDGVCNSDCSLREAMTASNADAYSPRVIEFNIDNDTAAGLGDAGTAKDAGCTEDLECTISPTSALPSITAANTTINGYTQSGAASNTAAAPAALNTVLRVVINGASAGAVHGLRVTSANNIIKGLVINGFSTAAYNGISISSNTNKIQGCFIGTNVAGTGALANDRGISIGPGTGNIIGTDGDGLTDAAERNLLSGNTAFGIVILNDDNTVAGNLIGVAITGTSAMSNTNGIYISAGSYNVIGTDGDGSGDASEINVISGNTNFGVQLGNTWGSNNIVAGNYIGINASGTVALANTYGLYLNVGGGSRVGTNDDGISDTLERNIISGNTNDGIYVVSNTNTITGNFIGTAANGTTDLGNGRNGIWLNTTSASNTVGGTSSTAANIIAFNGNAASEYGVRLVGASSDGNQILRNAIFSNQNQGIKLNADGANNNQAAPVISSQTAAGNDLLLSGTASNNATIQLFLSDDNSDGSYDEGETYVTQVLADGSGNWSYTLTSNKTTGTRFVATATDATNGTSEFSVLYTVTNQIPVATAQTVTGTEDTNSTITLAGTDGNGDTLTSYIISAAPVAGSLYQTVDGTTLGTQISTYPTTVTDALHRVIFVPALNGNGTGYGNFGFKVNDGTVDSAEASVTVNVTAVNDAPVANAQAQAVNQDTALAVTLTGSDIDANPISYAIVTGPANGVLSGLNSTTGAVTYTPNAGHTGADAFTFKVNDGTVDSVAATVSLTINAFARNVTWSTGSQSGLESVGTMTVTVNLSSASAHNVTVPFTLSGSATHGSGNDYTVTASPLTVTAGTTTASATLTVNDDTLDEDDETVALSMGAPTNATQGGITVHTATLTDNETAHVTITQSGGTTLLTEGGATDTYTVVLDSEPTAAVTVTLTPDADVSVSSASLTFTSGNWNLPQTITVSAVDDGNIEGAHTGTVTHVVTSGDTRYNAIVVSSVGATVTDNDAAGISMTESGGSSNVTEDGSTDSYQLVLTAAPTSDVTVTLVSNTQVSVSSSSLIFTPDNYFTVQTVTVTATDDHRVEGAHTGSIAHTVSSSDMNYNAMGLATLIPAITDNDSFGISVTQSSGSTNVIEGSTADTYDVVLLSEPAANVTIHVADNDQVGVDPETLTFTAGNWNSPQTIAVYGIDDDVIEGAHATTLTHSVTSVDSQYNNYAMTQVTVNLQDPTELDEAEANVAPVVYAATPIVVVENGTGKLFAAASDENTEDTLSYAWTQVSGPSVILSSASTSLATFVAPAFEAVAHTLVFRVSVSDGIATATADVTVTVMQNGRTVSTFGVEETLKKIAAVGNAGATVRETSGNGLLSYDLGDGYSIDGLSEAAHVLYVNGQIVIADSGYDQNRGIVAVIEKDKLLSVDLTLDEAFPLLTGVNATEGARTGDKYGYALAHGDFSGDGYDELFVIAQGTTYGTLYVLGFDTLETLHLIIGSEQELLKSPLMVSANINGLIADDAIMGVQLAGNTAHALASDVTQSFNGLLASSIFPTALDFAQQEPDFVLDTNVKASQLNRGDVNGDELGDLVISAQDSCETLVVFGSADIGSSENQLDGTHVLGCHDASSFSSAVVADVNGDGFADVVLGYPDAHSGYGLLAIHFGSSVWVDSDYATTNALLIYGEDDMNIGSWLLTGDSDGDGVDDIYTNLGNDGSSTVIRLAMSVTPTGRQLGPGGMSCELSTQSGHRGPNVWWLVLCVLPVFVLRLRKL
jgi:CSLREA domain-containing protein